MFISNFLSSETQKPISPKIERLARVVSKGLCPPPRISVPAWADQYRRLAKEAGSTSGRWETATVEVARGPMMAVTEPGVHIITAMVSTQLLKTALLENIFGYFAHLDPCPMLLLQPKEDAAEQFSKERVTPMVKATPVLRELIGTGKTRNSDETLLYKAFPGGFLALAGAGSPDNLARRPVRLILADEVDKYPVTREGDPITLAEERTATFGLNWLSVRACSPTVQEESRIESSYLDSDQRRASVSCPHCGHRQFLDFFRHVGWEKRKNEDGTVLEHYPKTARIFCESCGAQWSEGERLRALKTVRWHQTKSFVCCDSRQTPIDTYDKSWRDSADAEAALALAWEWSESDRHAVYRARCTHCGCLAVDNVHAGFQASKLFSPWQKDKPADIAGKWLKAQGDENKLQAWWNTQAGLPYRANVGKALRVEDLAARGERWIARVPFGVGLLTAGFDTQPDRIEVEVVGWGTDEESWSIDYEVFEGNPDEPEVWQRVDAYLLKKWYRYDGREFIVEAACIDSGGHNAQKVYEFAKARLGRRVYAVKGESARNGQRSPIWPTKKPSARTKQQFRPVIVGVNSAKDSIYRRLARPEPGPGYMHFPHDRDIGFYTQLTSERLVVKQSGGRKYWVWELPDGRRNEALDCRVYAYAALCALLHIGVRLNREVEAVSALLDGRAPPEEEVAPVLLVNGAGSVRTVRGPTVRTTGEVSKKGASLSSRLA